MTVQDAMPYEFREYHGTPALKLRDQEILARVDGTKLGWPGKHKNVFRWVLLASGKCVGWNENPATGWTFPVYRLKPGYLEIYVNHIKANPEVKE